ncbi:MAG: DNA polymerase III subunit gamma/tau [Microgenomates group bacterium Gr01-1014_7]|nr:MAG: DNA polymerase III subunit gamma/tau [Microgenomates group bacterium Gr01-1014_7]
MHIAFYLKYRPQNLDDLIGQEAVKRILLSAFVSKKLSHAYLFVGPRGTGKTSTARILAKMVNCEDKNPPCNKCEICISITDGSNLDLIEIDAASNRGIEDIRALREKVKLSPSASRKKVYIIDEAHMLTTEAFNALLKTLEEPPGHALFILATTEVGKMPQTILSRVQRLDFKLARATELLQTLKKITEAEKIDIDGEALNLLVKKSDGSFRDGVKLLDQTASLLKGKITAKILEESLKLSQFDDILDLTKAIVDKNTNKGLLNMAKQLEHGVEVKELVFSLMDTLRNLMLIKNGLGEQLVKPGLTEDKYDQLVALSEGISNQYLIKSLDILQTGLEQLKYASISSLPLELAVVEMTQGVILNPPKADEGSLTDVSLHSKKLRDSSPAEPVQNDKSGDLSDLSKIKEKWTFVLETIRPYNFSLEALLRAISIRECTDTQVIMEVPYSFHQRILEAPKNRDLLESILSDILGRSIHVATILGNRPQRKEDIVNIEVAADDEIIRAAAEIFNSDSVN